MNIKLQTEYDLNKAEEYLNKNPADFALRSAVLNSYFYIFPDRVYASEAKAHVLWFIENRPDFSGPWHEWATHFMDFSGEERRALEIWHSKVSEAPLSAIILQNAGVFSFHLEPGFSVKCNRSLSLISPNDPQVLEDLGRRLSWGTGHQDEQSALFESVDILARRLDMTWNRGTFQKLNRTYRWFGFMKLPATLERALLRLIAMFEREYERERVQALVFGLEAAILTNNQDKTRIWSEELELLYHKIAGGLDWSISIPIQFILARAALRLGEYSKVEEWIAVVSRVSADSIFSLRAIDEPLLEDLLRSGLRSSAKALMRGRAVNLKKDKETREWSHQLFEEDIFDS